MTIYLREPERSRVLPQLRASYEDGLRIRDIADQIGFSYTATRAMLLSAGTVLRPKSGAPLRPVPLGARPLAVVCPVCEALVWSRCTDQSFRPRPPHVKRARLAATVEAAQ